MKKIVLLCILGITCMNNAFAQWIAQGPAFTDLGESPLQIVIPNASSAWSMGDDYDANNKVIPSSEFIRTVDSGQTWTTGTVPTPNTFAWSGLSAINADTAWGIFFNGVTDVGGGIWRTNDGGQTWTQQDSGKIFTGSTAFPDWVYFWDADSGVALGDPVNKAFQIYTTSDGGTNWNAVPDSLIPKPLSSEFGTTSLFAVYKGTIWAGTSIGRVLKSTDKGYTWTLAGVTGLSVMSKITFKDDLHGIADDLTALPFTFMQTNDGGATWTPFKTPPFITDINFVPGTGGLLVCAGIDSTGNASNFGSAYSFNGNDWTIIDQTTPLNAANFFSDSIGYGIGYTADFNSTQAYKYGGTFVTAVPVIEAHSFNLHVFPNPARDNIYVSFDANNFDPINVRIYDLLGRTVFGTTYHDKTQLWLRSINLNNLSNGIYTLEVNNNGNKEVQKIVVQH